MDKFAIMLGLSLSLIGVFIKYLPSMLSPYNTMSAEKLKNVDLKKIASLYQKGFLIIGLATIGGYYFFNVIKMPLFAEIFTIIPILAFTPILLAKAQKYDKNETRKIVKWLPTIFLGVIFIFVISLIGYGIMPTKIIINNNSLKITGQYGITTPIDQIEKCELLEKLPRITTKTKGMAMSNIRKGHFKMDNFGKCRLILTLKNPPYIFVELKNGDKIIFNSSDSTSTKEHFKSLMQ